MKIKHKILLNILLLLTTVLIITKISLNMQNKFIQDNILNAPDILEDISRISVLTHNFNLVLLFTVLSLLTTAIVIALIIFAIVLAPISKLKKMTTAVINGNLNVGLDIKRDDVVGGLVNDFNIISSKLKDLTISKDYVDKILGRITDILI